MPIVVDILHSNLLIFSFSLLICMFLGSIHSRVLMGRLVARITAKVLALRLAVNFVFSHWIKTLEKVSKYLKQKAVN